ncbi:MAG: hypothetical protein AB1393_12100 [Candidatus Edwardsbacteria bacterium]
MELLNKFGIPQDHPNISQEYFFYQNPLLPLGSYSEIAIRQKLFSFVEDFFFLTKGTELHGMIGVGIPVIGKSTSAEINLMVLPKDKTFLSSLLQYVFCKLPLLAVKEITKIKFCIVPTNQRDKEIGEFIKEVGFVLEAELKNELGFDKGVTNLVYHYEKKYIEDLRNKFLEVQKSLSPDL